MSFTDSFLDFDSIKDWFEDILNPDMADGAKVEIGILEVDSCRETDVQEHFINQSDSNVIGSKPIVVGSGPIDCESHIVVKEEERKCDKSGNLNCLIEEDMGKVSLIGRSEKPVVGGEIDMKSDIMEENGVESKTMSDEDESESSESEGESTSKSSSSSSSSSSGEDDDQDNDVEEEEEKEKEKEEEKDNMKVKVDRQFNVASEVEEGEIRDADGPDIVGQTHDNGENDDDDNDEDEDEDDKDEEMVTWIDADVADDEEDGGDSVKGPIRSKNELEVRGIYIYIYILPGSILVFSEIQFNCCLFSCYN